MTVNGLLTLVLVLASSLVICESLRSLECKLQVGAKRRAPICLTKSAAAKRVHVTKIIISEFNPLFPTGLLSPR